MSYVSRLVLSNGLSFVSFLLVVFYKLHIKRDSMLRINLVMILLELAVYVVIGCFDAAAASLFALLRNYLSLKCPNRKEGVALKTAILLVGTAFSAWCGYRGGGTWAAYLPAASFLFCSVGYYLTKSPSALRVIDAADMILFWLVFDYLNLVAFNVVIDLFIVLFPFAERYVKLDHTDSTEQTPKEAGSHITV